MLTRLGIPSIHYKHQTMMVSSFKIFHFLTHENTKFKFFDYFFHLNGKAAPVSAPFVCFSETKFRSKNALPSFASEKTIKPIPIKTRKKENEKIEKNSNLKVESERKGNEKNEIKKKESEKKYEKKSENIHGKKKIKPTQAVIVDFASILKKENNADNTPELTVKVLENDHHVKDNFIPMYVWHVLSVLKKSGYEGYIVGGCVRDLYKKNIPKDFDILSTAEPKQVKKLFPRAFVVGSRFPICHVWMGEKIVEVSCFTNFDKSLIKEYFDKKKINDNVKDDNVKDDDVKDDHNVNNIDYQKKNINIDDFFHPKINSNLKYEWTERDVARAKDALRRDFTLNGLIYDPFKRIIYDYVGGIKDLENSKLSTILPAEIIFHKDSACLLRALRISARAKANFDSNVLNFFEENEAHKMILPLNKSRLAMELNYMMAYGSSEKSILLLWKFKFLDLLLPFQAKFFLTEKFPRSGNGKNFMLGLLRNLDAISSPDNPSDQSLWPALLAFHLALEDKSPSPLAASAATCTIRFDDHVNQMPAVQLAFKMHSQSQTCRSGSASTEPKAPVPGKSFFKELSNEAEEIINLSCKKLHMMSTLSHSKEMVLDLTGIHSNDMGVFTRVQILEAFDILKFKSAFDFVDGNNLEGKKKEFFEKKIQNYGNQKPFEKTFKKKILFAKIVLNTIYPNLPKKDIV